MRERDEIIRSLSGCDQYKIEEEYAHLIVAPKKWMRMRPEQRKQLVDSLRVKYGTTAATASIMP